MTYREAVEWLYGLQLYGMKLGLENMLRLCAALDIRLESQGSAGGTDATPTFIHVAGTNGKGSVCAMLDAIFRAAGIRCGLYTSPHLVTFRERIQVNGEMISALGIAAGLSTIREQIENWDPPPTFFEVTTALALHWFQSQNARVVVLETGLGGRLDATNVVTPIVSVLTPIGLDHQHVLGTTLAEIAAEKCGIIKSGVPVVSAQQDYEATAVILESARARSAACEWAIEPWSEKLGMAGAHQCRNAALAALALDTAAKTDKLFRIGRKTMVEGLASAKWPGRFQRAGGRVILDGAHNPSAAEALANTWRSEYGETRATIIFCMMRDKDAPGVIAKLAPIAARVFTVAVDNARTYSAAELANQVRATAPELPVTIFPALVAALRAAELHEEPILITGSLFLVGEAVVELGLAEPTRERSDQ